MAKDIKNPFGLKVELNPTERSITVIVRKRDGEDFIEVDSEVFALADVAEELQDNIACYGLSKLYQDRTSDVDLGPPKLAAMRELSARFAIGEWTKERIVGVQMASVEVEALAQMRNSTIPEIQRSLKGYSSEQREKILNNPSVKALAATIKTQRETAEPVSLDDLMA